MATSFDRRLSVLEKAYPQTPLTIQADRELRRLLGVAGTAGHNWMSTVPTPELLRVRGQLLKEGGTS